MENELKYQELTKSIISAAQNVHQALGPGFERGVYLKALELELRQQGIAYERQPSFPITYLDQKLGECVLDFIVDDKVVVEVTIKSRLEPEDYAEVRTHLRLAAKEVALVFSHHSARLDVRRVQPEREYRAGEERGGERGGERSERGDRDRDRDRGGFSDRPDRFSERY